MISEELEFRISQYADGSLPADEKAALEATLASDAEAQTMLESYRQIDVAMKRELGLPAMNWDRLASHLSDAVAAEESRLEQSSYSIRLFTYGRIAVAAMVLLAVGSVTWMTIHRTSNTPGPGTIAVNVQNPTAIPSNAVAIAEVSGPSAEVAMQPGVEEVAIGPAPQSPTVSYAASEDLVYRTPRVLIASTYVKRQDSASLPF